MKNFVSKIPHRIPIIGGFTDFPQYFEKNKGRTISCCINKYTTFKMKEKKEKCKISIFSEAAHGAGLASSGAFYCGLVSILCKKNNFEISKEELSEISYYIETYFNKNLTGKQDQLSCLLPGISTIEYNKNGDMSYEIFEISKKNRKIIDESLLLFDSNERGGSLDTISDVFSKKESIKTIKKIHEASENTYKEIKKGNIFCIKESLNIMSKYRKELSKCFYNKKTEYLLNVCKNHNVGARITGAGTGFLLCFVEKNKQKEFKKEINLKEIDFNILWND